MEQYDEKLHEECGVFGVWSEAGTQVAKDVYYGLLALQHRGQESAGIAVCKTDGPRDIIDRKKDMGLVTEVFSEEDFAKLQGNMGVGHVRYSTTGASNLENAQPLVFHYLKGTLAMVHNGNIVNDEELKMRLFDEGLVLRGTTDSEKVACLIARLRATEPSIEKAVKKAASILKGGYAIILMSPRKIVCMRDPLGLKPLCLGKIPTGYVVASESCALTAVGAEFIRDIEPGEVLTISKKGLESDRELCGSKHAHCVFEYIYFARLDSKIDNISVYSSRFRAGGCLADTYPVEADVVTGVPDSGLAAAAGYADRAGIPFRLAFQKNSYIGRTFIKPTQEERESAVHMKLNVLGDVVRDKRVVLIDDSIVRGTTIARLIRMLKHAGAKEVHVRISSPPFLHPCFYGTDVPETSQLIAKRLSTEEIREKIGADSLGYLKLNDLNTITNGMDICRACFDGNYPTEVYQETE